MSDKILSDPKSAGFCTFEEFRKNKDKWTPKKDMLFQSVDIGGHDESIKRDIRDHRYYLDGYRCETLEAVDTLAKTMGIPIDSIVSGGIVKEKVDNGKLRLHIHFMSKEQFEKRKNW